MHKHGHVDPGHGYYPEKRADTGSCPSGQAYYVCANSPFEGCCSTDPCSNGHCANYPFDASWKPSIAIETATETQTIGSYTTIVTMTPSPMSTAGTLTSTLPATSDSPLISSIISEISAISSFASSHFSDSSIIAQTSSVSRLSSSTHSSGTHHSSSTSSVLSLPSTSPQLSHTPKAGMITGISLGTAGAVALLLLMCCICYRRKTKYNIDCSKNQEDKELKAQLKKAAEIQAKRSKALRALENWRTGTGTDGAWASSPR